MKKIKKYPRLIIFVITILIAIFLFYEGMSSENINNFFLSLGYGGTFLGGLLYSYGFTSASATAVLLIISKEKILRLSILIAGLGALISDIIIYSFSKNVLLQELTMLKEEGYVIKFRNFLKKIFGPKYKYIMPIIAGILIMTPLPTEIGVTMLAGKKNISTKKFIVMAYILHTLGILIILLLSKLL
ncbi:MAG: hypothetical protein M0P94_01205 [Candidatus Absconditabacterales bacterium]|nr:hypothetical protein [Candidatus Absconditabacterales bacterium]